MAADYTMTFDMTILTYGEPLNKTWRFAGVQTILWLRARCSAMRDGCPKWRTEKNFWHLCRKYPDLARRPGLNPASVISRTAITHHDCSYWKCPRPGTIFIGETGDPDSEWICVYHRDKWNADRARFLADGLACQMKEI